MKNEMILISADKIKDKIYTIRGKKVMIDSDLAKIYGYTTKNFNRQVKNNIEKFDNDFMFQLTKDELNNLDCENNIKVISSMSRTLPYAFTEQGIYMLMTVLKGELATKQSKALIRIFKEMKDYILENKYLATNQDILKLAIQTNENTNSIKRIENTMATKEDLVKVINDLSDVKISKEYLILNGRQVESDIAYNQIYSKAKKSIFIIDNYISLKTLVLLKDISKNVDVTIFSDNINKGLHKIEYQDFIKEYSNIKISFKKTNGIYHDRYIILDYGLDSETIYLCGASSKDSGKKITTITRLTDNKLFSKMIDDLLVTNKELVF